MGLLGKMSVRKGHFGENWAVKVKTGLTRKMSVPKGLKVGIRSVWVKLGLLGKMRVQRGLLGKNRAFVENQCAEGSLRKIGHFVEKMGLLGK